MKRIWKDFWRSPAMEEVVCAHLEESLEIFREVARKDDEDYKRVVKALKRVIEYYGGNPT